MMDEDTKLVLQMWRVQVMVNDELQRRIHILEKDLWEKEHVGCTCYCDLDGVWSVHGGGCRRDIHCGNLFFTEWG
jgi:hypothetical protein